MSAKQGQVIIVNKLGLHARAASKFVGLANQYPCDVFLAVEDREVNAKSILGVLMLAAAKGTQLSLRCEGTQADEAYDALSGLVADGFGET
ncbi:MAG: HPr family phosphocarrier protein [Deltaproteobacteria bacterium]|nr:HPr family phosphocarrier protein [Nannocystaceae bacterium]